MSDREIIAHIIPGRRKKTSVKMSLDVQPHIAQGKRTRHLRVDTQMIMDKLISMVNGSLTGSLPNFFRRSPDTRQSSRGRLDRSSNAKTARN